MNKQHFYKASVTWTGNKGSGTSDYAAYGREYTISIAGKPELHGSADTPFRGDPKKYNPEDMLLCAISTCHMLWFLHLCADNKIIVTGYKDNASGTMEQYSGGGGKFTQVVLRPEVTIGDKTQIEKANSLHAEANKKCFIANSCNFPVTHEPTCKTAS